MTLLIRRKRNKNYYSHDSQHQIKPKIMESQVFQERKHCYNIIKAGDTSTSIKCQKIKSLLSLHSGKPIQDSKHGAKQEQGDNTFYKYQVMFEGLMEWDRSRQIQQSQHTSPGKKDLQPFQEGYLANQHVNQHKKHGSDQQFDWCLPSFNQNNSHKCSFIKLKPYKTRSKHSRHQSTTQKKNSFQFKTQNIQFARRAFLIHQKAHYNLNDQTNLPRKIATTFHQSRNSKAKLRKQYVLLR